MTRLCAWAVGPAAAILLLLAACTDDGARVGAPALDPESAPRVAVDRFSDEAGTLFLRSAMGGLPDPNEPIDFDQQFILDGLGPRGEKVSYYNLDVQLGRAMEVHRIVDTDGVPVAGQLAIVDALPGDEGYADFWRYIDHEAPAGYVANSIASADALRAEGWAQTRDFEAFNRPLVPEGSTATRRFEDGESLAWFEEAVVSFLAFAEAPISVRGDFVPYSLIFVCFDIPPGPDGMPMSGFCQEQGGATHNVLETLPGDALYSPLWDVRVYAPEAFDAVFDLPSALAAEPVADLAMVNCPIAQAP